MSERDPLINVVMDDPVFAMPERVAFDNSLSYTARLVACLWFARRRKPTVQQIEDVLDLPNYVARVSLEELEAHSTMVGLA